MEKKLKQRVLLAAFGILLFAAAMNFGAVIEFVKTLFDIALPIATGLIIAFILNVPVKRFEQLISFLLKRFKRDMSKKAIHRTALVLTLLCLLLVLFITCTMLIPELVRTVKSIIELVHDNWTNITSFLGKIDSEFVNEWLNKLNIEKVLTNISNSASNVLTTLAGAIFSTAYGIFSFICAFVISIYTLLGRDTLIRQMKKFMYAFFSEKFADSACYMARITADTYAKFLSGQFVEAIILGTLIFVAFTVFGFPYAGLIAVLTSLFAFVPYMGAFASCAIGAFLMLLIDPRMAILSIIVYTIVQFIENQFIYPHVVGNSVGLSPLWTLVAALIGGKLLGIIGMIFFIPLTAVIYKLISQATEQKLKEKKLDL